MIAGKGEPERGFKHKPEKIPDVPAIVTIRIQKIR
jgi:hypothetical protein